MRLPLLHLLHISHCLRVFNQIYASYNIDIASNQRMAKIYSLRVAVMLCSHVFTALKETYILSNELNFVG